MVVRDVQSAKLIPLAEALYRGGIRFLEVTYSANGRISDKETANQIESLSHHFKSRMHIGAGTVLTENQVLLTKAAGGRFIISPDTDIAVIQKTKAFGMISIPGALTPSEIKQAHRAGADFVKLFPISRLGADYVKAIRAPLPHIRLLAVGGINLQNMSEYRNAGVCGFGIGTSITDKKLLETEDYEGITKLAERYVAATV